jgi:hypothetical protein
MDLHIQKVADKMGENRGAGQWSENSLKGWHDARGQVTLFR